MTNAMSFSRVKKLKIQDNESKNHAYILHNICNWFSPNQPAIEYHDLEEVKIISYNELQIAKKTVFDCLRCIRYHEFIGINFDILDFCVPSLMLGILNSGNAFFYISSDFQTYKEMFISLRVKYIFTKYVTSNREVVCQFNIHGQLIHLTKLLDSSESSNSETWYNFAYAIATSGSTGTPKVVRVSHSCILPNITDLKRILNITKTDKIAQLTNFTFDPSIVEIFLSLSCAATLFMVSKSLKNQADSLLDKLLHTHVTVLQITPSLLFCKWSSGRLRSTILGQDSYLRIILLGGEPFPNIKLLLEASHPLNGTRFFNIYGITEVSCWASINEVVKNNVTDESYLGPCLSETILQVRNYDNEVITAGNGILHIGSSTRICIVGNENIEDTNKPIFRDTGDVVSTDDHGRIFYKGRRNNVVKRFGNKVNLRKLERVAAKLSFVRNCAALWNTENHKLYLCLSTARTEEESSRLENDVISHLRELPAIYKPDKIIILEHFHFTTSGKICLASLRRTCLDSETKIATANNLHIDVSEIFGNLWDQHIKSRDAGFLTLGGTSITALQISSAAAETFETEFPELIGSLLRNVKFHECVSYIRTILVDRDRGKVLNHCIDIFPDDKFSREISETEKFLTNRSSSDVTISTDQNDPHQWYKCRGRIYGDATIQEQNIKSFLANISSIEVSVTYNLQKCVDASPTLYRYSDSELFVTVGSHSGIICTVNLLEKDSRLYEVKLPDRVEASVLTLANFRGIVGCYDGYVYCINLKTGDVIWKFQTQDTVKCTAITCPKGTTIFVGSYDHYIYCLSVENGVQIWKTKVSQGGICATGSLHPRLTLVLFGTLDGSCLALQRVSGQVTWRRKSRDPIFVAPVVLQTGHVLFCSVAGTLYCFDIETDCQVWQYEIRGNVFSYPVLKTNRFTSGDEYIILASHNKNLYCLELPQGAVSDKEPKLKYALQLCSPIFATPWCEDRYIYVVCTDGTFQVVDLLKGELLASKRLPGESFSSPVIHDNVAVLGCRDNNLYVLKLETDQCSSGSLM